jgi:hypothetical protein
MRLAAILLLLTFALFSANASGSNSAHSTSPVPSDASAAR